MPSPALIEPPPTNNQRQLPLPSVLPIPKESKENLEVIQEHPSQEVSVSASNSVSVMQSSNKDTQKFRSSLINAINAAEKEMDQAI